MKGKFLNNSAFIGKNIVILFLIIKALETALPHLHAKIYFVPFNYLNFSVGTVNKKTSSLYFVFAFTPGKKNYILEA